MNHQPLTYDAGPGATRRGLRVADKPRERGQMLRRNHVSEPLRRQEIVVAVFEARDDGFGNEKTLAGGPFSVVVGQQETGLVFASLYDPLQLLATVNTWPDDESLDPLSRGGEGRVGNIVLVGVYHNIATAATV